MVHAPNELAVPNFVPDGWVYDSHLLTLVFVSGPISSLLVQYC